MAGDLERGEPHPSAQSALEFVGSHSLAELAVFQESFSSCAIEGNRLAEICSETLRRVMHHEPVSDRYILGLAWAMRVRQILTGPTIN
jgi:hypothetical protein